MGIKTAATPQVAQDLPKIAKLLDQYGCGPVQFAGTTRHYMNVTSSLTTCVDLAAATPRDRFEALARSVRDILSQRWLLPRRPTSARTRSGSTTSRWSFSSAARWQTMSRIFCSIRCARKLVQERNSIWIEILEQEPDAGLGNGGLGTSGSMFH